MSCSMWSSVERVDTEFLSNASELLIYFLFTCMFYVDMPTAPAGRSPCLLGVFGVCSECALLVSNLLGSMTSPKLLGGGIVLTP